MISAAEKASYSPMTEPAISSSDEPIVAQANSIQAAMAGTFEIPAGTSLSPALSTGTSAFQTLLDAINQMIQSLGALIGFQSATTDRAITNPSTQTQDIASPNHPWYEIINEEPEVQIPDLGLAKPLPTNPQETPRVEANPPGNGFTLGEPDAIPELTMKPPKKTGDAPKNTAPKKINTGSQITQSGEFLWKPVSEKDQKLAILIPLNLTGKVKSVSILSPDKTKVLAKGTYSGVGNGNREHFRFPKAGEKYPDNSIVLITLKDGSTRSVTIRETSQRYTR